MSKPRSKPKTRYHVFLVEPEPGFSPTNWRQTPQHYQVIEYRGAHPLKGPVDAKKFLQNHASIRQNRFDRWVICLDLWRAQVFAEPSDN